MKRAALYLARHRPTEHIRKSRELFRAAFARAARISRSAEGVPLGIGQQGPIWLVKSGAQVVDGSDPKHGDWVWNVFYIKIGE